MGQSTSQQQDSTAINPTTGQHNVQQPTTNLTQDASNNTEICCLPKVACNALSGFNHPGKFAALYGVFALGLIVSGAIVNNIEDNNVPGHSTNSTGNGLFNCGLAMIFPAILSTAKFAYRKYCPSTNMGDVEIGKDHSSSRY